MKKLINNFAIALVAVMAYGFTLTAGAYTRYSGDFDATPPPVYDSPSSVAATAPPPLRDPPAAANADTALVAQPDARPTLTLPPRVADKNSNPKKKVATGATYEPTPEEQSAIAAENNAVPTPPLSPTPMSVVTSKRIVTTASASPVFAEPMTAKPTGFYIVSANETLRTILARWAASSTDRWTLVWDAPSDYSVSADANYTGGLVDAVSQLFADLSSNGAPFGVEVYDGNHVIRVTRAK